jgi:hypothetical protein
MAALTSRELIKVRPSNNSYNSKILLDLIKMRVKNYCRVSLKFGSQDRNKAAKHTGAFLSKKLQLTGRRLCSHDYIARERRFTRNSGGAHRVF